MTKFYFPQRYDTTADEGKWHTIKDELDNVWLEVKLALVDKHTANFMEASERLKQKYPPSETGTPNEAWTSKTPLDAEIEVFVNISVLDWRLKDAGGKNVPFNRDDAVAYFTNPAARFALDSATAFAGNIMNYQPKEQKELPEKNS